MGLMWTSAPNSRPSIHSFTLRLLHDTDSDGRTLCAQGHHQLGLQTIEMMGYDREWPLLNSSTENVYAKYARFKVKIQPHT